MKFSNFGKIGTSLLPTVTKKLNFSCFSSGHFQNREIQGVYERNSKGINPTKKKTEYIKPRNNKTEEKFISFFLITKKKISINISARFFSV